MTRQIVSLPVVSPPRLARRVALLAALMLAGLSTACASFPSHAEADLTSLVVRNNSFFDVNVYVVTSPGNVPLRLGTAVGMSNITFPIAASKLQSGGYLAVELHPIGTRYWWASDAVAVGDGVLAVLDVNTDAFGDCSQSVLRTVVTADSAPARSP